MASKVFAFPLLVSVVFHSLILAVVLLAWEGTSEPRTVQRPSIVQAQIVEFTPQSRRQAEAEAEAERQRVIDMRERQRQQEAQEAERRRQQEADRQRQAREREQQQAQREREERERAQREQAERERQEAERQRREQQEEAERQAAERQRRFDEALADEGEFLQAQQSEIAAQSYTDVISARIENNWSRPPSARLGMQVVLEIQLVPTGRVVDVSIVESSGNAAFDRSAEQAVRRIEQFEEVRDMPSEVFERHFRRLRLVFNPEDLRL